MEIENNNSTQIITDTSVCIKDCRIATLAGPFSKTRVHSYLLP